MGHPVRNPFLVLGLVIAVLLAAVGGYLVYGGVETSLEGKKARTTPFLVMDVDLSRVGTYKGTIHHFFTMAHANLLTVEVDPPLAAGSDNAIASLSAVVTMPGNLGSSETIDGANRNWEGHATGLPLCELSMRSTGDIPFMFVVQKPAKAFAGHRQKLVGKYDACGLEQVAAMMMGAIGVGFLIVGLAFGIPLLLYVRRLKREGRF